MSELDGRGPGFAARIRNYLVTGLIVLAPATLTLWVLFRLLNWFDNLIGRYLRIEALGPDRVPGLGIVAVVVLLIVVGAFASWIGTRSLTSIWDGLLTRIPGVGILYGSTKSLGEALFTRRREAFRQVVLVQWPHPGIWRVGFITGRPSEDVARVLDGPHEVVFVPHTPNPASGFVHYAPESQIIRLDWTIEQGLKVIVSGGVVQPGMDAPAESNEPPRAV